MRVGFEWIFFDVVCMWFVVGGVCEIWLVVGYDFDVFDCVFVKL